MPAEAYDTGIVPLTAKEFPLIAVNVLDKLGYYVRRNSKQLYQIIADEKRDDQQGRDRFKYEWRLVMTWRKAEDGGTLVKVVISEHAGNGEKKDCFKRCEKVLLELHEAAERAKEIAEEYEPSTAYGAARFGTDEDLKERGYITKKPEATRLLLAQHGEKEYLSLSERATYMHALVCGGTGVGKSSGFFVPNLIERLATNMLVTEASPDMDPGELYTLTSGWRKQAGHQIYSFNPADMTSTRINPVDRVRNAKADYVAAEAQSLAESIIKNSQKEGARVDQMWDNSEQQLLVPLILHAAVSEEDFGHIGAIRWLLLSGLDNIKKAFKHTKSDLAQMEFEGWLESTGEGFRNGVISGLKTKLNPWMTDQTIALTAKSDIKPEDFRDKLFTFYLCVPSRSANMKLVSSLIFNYLFDALLDERKNMKHPLQFLLDEFPNFGYIAGIADVLSIIRKRNIGLTLGFQDYMQLERVYSPKEAQIILSQPATQVYFKQKAKEAKALSEALAKTTIEEQEVTDSGRVHERVMGKSLMTIDELMNLGSDSVIIMTPDVRPVKIKKIRPGAYDHATAYEPPERPVHEISDLIRTRAREDREQQAKQKPEGKKPFNNRERSRNDRSFEQKNRSQRPKEDDKEVKPKEHSDEPPDMDDVWQH